jgi:hypothetical protein
MSLSEKVTPEQVRAGLEQHLALATCKLLHGQLNGHACQQCTQYSRVHGRLVAAVIKATALAAIGPRNIKGSEYQAMGRAVRELERIVSKLEPVRIARA